jgi:hypothetical protein
MQEWNIGKVADWNSAHDFSTESILNVNSLGGHCFWFFDKNWKKRVIQLVNEYSYIPISNLLHYIREVDVENYYKRQCLIKRQLDFHNSMDIDLYFVKNGYALSSIQEAIQLVQKKNMYGMILHPKQLYNMFLDTIHVFKKKNIFVRYRGTEYLLSDFIQKIESFSFRSLYALTMQCIYKNLSSEELLLLVFIGNKTVGDDLINKLIQYKDIQTFAVGFCIKRDICEPGIIDRIKYHFHNCSIFVSNEFGNDIVPTLLMFDEIKKHHSFTYVMKLHTKREKTLYEQNTLFLLSQTLNNLLLYEFTTSHCIGSSYKHIQSDLYNRDLYARYAHLLEKEHFIEGTFFLTSFLHFSKVYLFFREHSLHFFMSTMYDDNNTNYTHSYVHFVERLFGIM